MSDNPYTRAKKRVQMKKGFYNHLAVYIAVNIFMMILMTIADGEPFGWIIPALGWGIGLFSHYVRVFGFPFGGIGGKDWEEKEIEKELEREGYDLKNFRRDDQLELDELDEEELDLHERRPERSKGEIERQWKDEDFI